MNARLTLTTTALLVLAATGLGIAQTPAAVSTTTQPRPKVVRPAIAATPTAAYAVVADDPQAPTPAKAPAAVQAIRPTTAPEAPVPAAAPKVVQSTRVVRGQLVNLRLEFTITDQIGSATPVKKTVTMNVADGESGRIRTNADVFRKGSGGTQVPLSIDAKPEIEGAKIRLSVSLEYQLLNDATPDSPIGKTYVSQAVTSVLNDGVQAILSQSADPLTDRKVTLEVKATIIK